MEIHDQNTLKIIEGSTAKGEKIELTLDKPIPKGLLGKVIKAKITQTNQDGRIILTTQDGKKLKGQLKEPLPKGTELVFTTKADGKVKVLQLKMQQEAQPPLPQQGKDGNKQQQQNNTGREGKQQPTTEPGKPSQTTAPTTATAGKLAQPINQQFQKILQQSPIKMQTIGDKPLPITDGLKLNATITAGPDKNGFYQALLSDKAGTQVKIKLPEPVPLNTKLAIKILSHNEVRVLEVKTPSSNNVTSNKPVETAKTSTPQPVVTNNKTVLPVDTKPAANTPASQPLESKLPVTITTTNPQVLQQVSVIIPQTAKLDLISQVIKVLQQPQTEEPLLQQATSKAEAPAPQQTTTQTAKLPLNVPLNGKLTQLPSPATPQQVPPQPTMQTTAQQPLSQPQAPVPNIANTANVQSNQATTVQNLPATHRLELPQGVRFDVNSPVPTAQGSTMAIRITTDGMAEVLRIVEPTPISGREDHQRQGASEQGQQSQKVSQHHVDKLLKIPAGTKFTAIVTSKSNNGLQTLSLPNGQKFQAQSAKPLPVGAEVTVKITSSGEAEITQLNLPQANAKTEALLEFSRKWESLRNALAQLKHSHPQAAKDLAGKLPNPEKGLLPQLLQFAEAVSNQSALKLLGDETLNLLRSLGIDFTADLTQLHHLQQKPDAPDGWRAFYFPFMTDEDPDQGAFYWRNQENEEGDKSTRFVVNLSLSELGPVQIDGLMQEKHHIMLKVRLHKIPTDTFEKDLQEIVQKFLEPLEIQGQVKVEISQTFETDPLHDILEHENHTGMVV